MYRLISVLKNPQKARDNESGSALIFAIILTIVTMSIVSMVVALGLTNIQKTMAVTSLTYFEMSAQSAISNALTVANSANGTQLLRQRQGGAVDSNGNVTNQVTGVLPAAYSDQGLKWRWYSKRIPGSSATSKYYIFATGYRATPNDAQARTLRVTISSIANAKGFYSTGTKNITYTPGIDAIAQWGIMGTTGVVLNNGAKVYSYVSDRTLNPTSSTLQGSIASNGNISLGGTAVSVDILNILSYNAANPTRCVGNAEACADTQQNKHTYGTTAEEVTKKVKAQCPNPAYTYPVFRSSARGFVLTPGCYNTLVFDGNTTISGAYNENNPANVYVKGNIEISSGVDINNGRDPLGLRIFSEGGTKATFAQGSTAANPTKFYGVMISSTLVCTDGTNSASSASTSNLLYFYGGLVCDKLNFGPGTNLWWDELSGELTQNNNVNRIWYTEVVEEVY